MSKKSLVFISYVYPPHNSIGAVRVSNFAEGLQSKYGWSVQVVVPRTNLANANEPTAENNGSVVVRSTRNTDLCKYVPMVKRLGFTPKKSKSGIPSCDCFKRSPEPQSEKRALFARVSDLLAVPDTRSGWIFWAYREAVRSLRRSGSNRVLISSGPPQSAHVAAAWAKRRTGCRWIADMRDPWTENPYNPSLATFAERWNKSLERRVLRTADVILCTTEAARQRFLSALPEFSTEQIVTIPNGFDPDDFVGLRPSACWPGDGRTVILHAGSLYGRRDPVPFLQAVSALHAEQPNVTPRIVFLGNWDEEVRSRADAAIARGGISQLVLTLASVSKDEALAMQAAADWLLLLGDSMPAMLQVPGKLFEYLAHDKPILSLFPDQSPVNRYLDDYSRMSVRAAPDDPEAILDSLRQLISRQELPGTRQRPLEELHRSHQIERLNSICESCLNRIIPPAQRGSSVDRPIPNAIEEDLKKEFV